NVAEQNIVGDIGELRRDVANHFLNNRRLLVRTSICHGILVRSAATSPTACRCSHRSSPCIPLKKRYCPTSPSMSGPESAPRRRADNSPAVSGQVFPNTLRFPCLLFREPPVYRRESRRH